MILSHDIKTLPIDLETFDFVEREYANEKLVRNKCGRDFLYYSLHYYFPDKFNRNKNNPILIDEDKIFGFPVNDTFSWLLIQFFKVPALFKKLGLSLSINDKQIRTEAGGTNFSEWCNYFGDNTLSLIIASNGIVRRVEMNPQAECFYKIASIKKQALADEKQKTNFTKWSKHKF